MKRVLFTLKFYPMREALLSEELRKRGLVSSAIAFSRRWAKFAARYGCFEVVHDFTKFYHEQQRELSDNTQIIHRLHQWEEHYGARLARIVAADRTIRCFSWQKQLKVVDALITFLRQIIEDEMPKAVIGELSSAPDLILWFIARKLGIKYLCPVHSRIWVDRIAFIDLEGQWEGLAEAYHWARENGLSPEEKARAMGLLSRFLQVKPHPSYMEYVAAKSSARKFIQRMRRLPDKLMAYRVDRQFAVDYSAAFTTKLLDDSLSLIRRMLAQLGLMPWEKAPKLDEKFILFPLHFQPEASTMVYAPFYENQLATIENIAKCLPVGYRLYVKEHMAMWGRRPLSFYKALRHIPAVKLIAPHYNIHHLIPLCDAVVTLTSTTGIEALLYGKPVIVLGKVFYELFDGVVKVRSFEELGIELPKVLSRREIGLDNVLKVVHSLFQCTYPGNLDDALYSARTLTRNNIEVLAEVLISKIPSSEQDDG
jgi:hypothetical protein